jgi:hypothetical protein
VHGLPNSQGKYVIYVVVDRLYKYAHFMTLKHPYSATMVAQEFFEHMFKLHGVPTSIVRDRDSMFIEIFGGSFFVYKVLSLTLAQQIIHKQMAKQK